MKIYHRNQFFTNLHSKNSFGISLDRYDEFKALRKFKANVEWFTNVEIIAALGWTMYISRVLGSIKQKSLSSSDLSDK